jgi:hypothetical protein
MMSPWCRQGSIESPCTLLILTTLSDTATNTGSDIKNPVEKFRRAAAIAPERGMWASSRSKSGQTEYHFDTNRMQRRAEIHDDLSADHENDVNRRWMGGRRIEERKRGADGDQQVASPHFRTWQQQSASFDKLGESKKQNYNLLLFHGFQMLELFL